MTTIDSRLSNKLANVSFVAVCAVAAIHMPSFSDKSTSMWFVSQFVMRVASFAVPMFFAISGFLLAGHCEEKDWYKRALHKRLWSLLIPYFVWCGISLGMHGFQFSLVGCAFGLDITEYMLSPELWYLRNLMLLILLSPVIVMCVRQFGLWSIGITYLLVSPSCAVPGVWNDIFSWTFNLMGLTFFMVGIWIRINGGGGTSLVGLCGYQFYWGFFL